MEHREEKAEKLKRFDDAFGMLLIVMSITTSIGLSIYSVLDLRVALGYFVASLGFWMTAHLAGSNPLFDDLEIVMKLTAWVLALLVTGSTFAKFALKVSILDFGAKVLVSTVTLTLSFAIYWWFGELISSGMRRKYRRLNFVLLILFLGGYLTF